MQYVISEKGKFTIISVEGDIEKEAESRALTEEISRLAEKGRAHFCFDLKKAKYLDSGGVSIFIHTLAETEERNGSVYMVVTEPQVRHVIELVGLDKLIRTYSSIEEFESEQM